MRLPVAASNNACRDQRHEQDGGRYNAKQRRDRDGTQTGVLVANCRIETGRDHRARNREGEGQTNPSQPTVGMKRTPSNQQRLGDKQ